ncbi:MAG: CshA/CshB family fibrillar adhesin-related protein, partial [Mucilaginibacter sp.]
MNKNLLFKIALLFTVFFQLANRASAQYAVGGTAPVALRNSIYWLTWNHNAAGSTLTAGSPASTATDVPAGTYVWQYSPTVQITATIDHFTAFDNATGTVAKKMGAYTSGSYAAGDGMNILYTGSDPAYSIPFSGLNTENASFVKFDIALSVQILINGVYTTVSYPGMVIADAESMAQGESFSAVNNGPIGWQLLNFRDGGDPNAGEYHLTIDNNGANPGSFKVDMDAVGGHSDIKTQAVMFARGANKLTDVKMVGYGVTAIAIGFVLPFDLGDAPTGFDKPEAYINDFSSSNVVVADGTYSANTLTPTPLTPQAKLYMGPTAAPNNVDADGDITLDGTATADDHNNNPDEDALSPSDISAQVNQNTDVTVTIPKVINNELVLGVTPDVYLYGWIDFNRDGKFSEDERAAPLTLSGSTSYTNQRLVFNKNSFLPNIKAGTTFARFRISKDQLTNTNALTDIDLASTTATSDGEIEDYQLTIAGATISGNVYRDGNGATAVSDLDRSTPFGTVSGAPALYAYLVDNSDNIVNPSGAAVTVDNTTGAYSITGANNGAYHVVISSVFLASTSGHTLTDITTNQLPATFVPSVDLFGSNNPSNGGTNAVEAGNATANLQVPVTISSLNAGAAITDVSFGIDQVPVAVADAQTVNTNTATDILIQSNDSDPENQLDPTSVVMSSFDTPGTFGTGDIVVAGEGTYHLNATTGVITFTSDNTFTGTALQPINYKIADIFGVYSNVVTVTPTVKIGGQPDQEATTIGQQIVITDLKSNDRAAANSGTVTIGLPSTATGHGGTVSVTSNQVTYNPAAGFTGTDTFNYTLTKNSQTSENILVTVLVSPTGGDDPTTTLINTPAVTNVALNDAGGTGATMSLVHGVGNDPANGTVDAPNDAAGTITYHPNHNFTGTDSYKYKITTLDNTLSTANLTVTIGITPIATADSHVIPFNSTGTLINIKNDDLSAGDGSTVTIVGGGPTNGALSGLDPATGNVTYKPTGNFTGTDSFTYTVTSQDGTLTSAAVTVTLTVAPTPHDDSHTIAFNSPGTVIHILTDDINAGTGATVTNPLSSTPGHGTLSNIAYSTGDMTYTPNNNYVGTDSYTYKVTSHDNTLTSASTATVTLHIRPVGVADTTFMLINGDQVTINILGNDGASATGTLVSVNLGSILAGHGQTTIQGTNIAYKPDHDFVGTDTFTYTITNNGETSDEILVTINVKPVGQPDVDNTTIGTPKTTNVIAGTPASTGVDSPGSHNGNASTITDIVKTANATTVAVSNTDPNSIVYTPAPGFVGIDTYTYKLMSSDGIKSDAILVTINVKPTGQPDADTTTIGTAKVTNVIAGTPASTGVDSPGSHNGNATTITDIVKTANATTVAVSNTDPNSIVYTPAPGFVGTDTYTYKLMSSDGIKSDAILVTINVKPTGQPDVDVTTIGTAKTTNVIAGTPASTGVDSPGSHGGTASTITDIVKTANATTVAVSNTDPNSIVYTPTPGFVGIDTYTYKLISSDGIKSDAILVTINVKPTGQPDVDNTLVNTPVTTNVIAGTPASTGVDAPGSHNGNASTITDIVKTANATTVAVSNTDPNSIVYTPASSFTGTDTYTYKLMSSDGIKSDAILVTINVKPTGQPDPDTTTIALAKATTVRTNDAGGTNSTLSVVTQPGNGSAGSIDNTAGAILYTPNTTFTGKDTYTYKITSADGTQTSSPVKVTIIVKPTGQPDFATTLVGQPVLIPVIVNDNGGNGAIITNVSVPANGGISVVNNTNGSITYTPNAGYIGTDTFTYNLTSSDGFAVSSPILVTINIRPAGIPDNDLTPINTPVTTNVVANDGVTGVTVASTNGSNGTTTPSGDGVSVIYTPANGFVGTDTYTYTITKN